MMRMTNRRRGTPHTQSDDARPALEAKTVGHRRSLAWVSVAAVLLIAWLVHPFATAVLLGALIGFTLQPVHDTLARRTRRPLLVALSIVLMSTVVIAGAVVGFATLFITRAMVLANEVRDGLGPDGAISGWVEMMIGWLGRLGVPAESLPDRLRDAAGTLATGAASVAGAFAASTFSVLIGLFFALLTAYLVLLDWSRIVTAVTEVSPLSHEDTRSLLFEFQRVGRMTLSGTVLTGLAQGALAIVGFAITGVPEPGFFGVATALASLIPAVGTMLVWVPVGLYLFATGHPGGAIVELTWGLLVVVGVSDYVIRPRVVGDDGTPVLLTFLAVFGGLELLGLSGLIVGPVAMAMAIAVLRLYAGEERVRKATRG